MIETEMNRPEAANIKREAEKSPDVAAPWQHCCIVGVLHACILGASAVLIRPRSSDKLNSFTHPLAVLPGALRIDVSESGRCCIRGYVLHGAARLGPNGDDQCRTDKIVCLCACGVV